MKEDACHALGDFIEPIRPKKVELHPIAPNRSWGIAHYTLSDTSILPFLYTTLSHLSESFDIKTVAIRCRPWNTQVQHLDELRVVINDSTYAWAQDEGDYEHGTIHVVGDPIITGEITHELRDHATRYAMPSVGEIFPPLAKGTGWKESRRQLDPEKLRYTILQHNEFKSMAFYKPIEDWRHDWQGRLLATMRGDTYMHITPRGYEMIGNTETIRSVGRIIDRL